jgi:hypothetical protein
MTGNEEGRRDRKRMVRTSVERDEESEGRVR